MSYFLKTKKMLWLSLIIATFIVSQLGIIFLASQTPAVVTYAATASVNGPNFTDYTGSAPIYSPSYWSAVESGLSSTVNSGIINTDTEKGDLRTLNLEEAFKYDSELEDDFVLMIKSLNESDPARYGYKNNSAIEFKPNSYYMLSVLVKTSVVSSNGASIYLNIAPDISADYNFVNVTSNKHPLYNNYYVWTPFTFFIQTDTTGSYNAFLELWLGSKTGTPSHSSTGSVFFDSINIDEISNSKYYELTSDYYEGSAQDKEDFLDYNRVIDLKNDVIDAFDNPNFDNGLTGWEQTEGQGADDVFAGVGNITSGAETLDIMGVEDSSTTINDSGTKSETKQAMYIHNKIAANTAFKSTSFMTVAQHTYYRLSVLIKTSELTEGGAWIRLTERTDNPDDEENPPLTKTISGINSSSNALSQYNGYTEYVLYIYGNPYADKEIFIEMGLGTAENQVTGWIIFDDIIVQRVTYENFAANAASDGNNATFNLFKESDTSNILNGTFNYTANEKTTATYPLAAKNWSIGKKNSNDTIEYDSKYWGETGSGVVNTDENHWTNNQENYGPNGLAVNPGPVSTFFNETNNNVFMLRNDDANSFIEYKSSSFAIPNGGTSTDSLIAIEFYMQTQQLNTDIGMDIRLVTSSGVELAAIRGVSSSYEWNKYTIYFKNSNHELTANLVISFGSVNKPTSGLAFIDYVHCTLTDGIMLLDSNTNWFPFNPTKLTNDYFNSLKGNLNANFAVLQDLSVDRFTSFIPANDGSGIHTPNTFKGEDLTDDDRLGGIKAGIINVSDNPMYPSPSPYPAKHDSSAGNLLMINNNMPTHYAYTSTLSYSLTQSSYYKISIWVYTKNIVAGTPVYMVEDSSGNLIYDRDLDPRTKKERNADTTFFGVNISLSNANKSFRGIITDTESQDNNGWVQYSFYVSSSEDLPSELTLSLGSTDYPTQGYAFFDHIEITDITYDEYSEVDKNDKYNLRTIAKLPDEGDGDGETPDDTTGGGEPINLWLLIPSIILGIALIVALIGYSLRKVKFRNPFRRKDKLDYSRDTTLNEDIVKRELATIRAEKLKLIDEQIAEVETVVAANKAEYEASTKEDKNKGKTEKLFNKYARERAKLQKQLDNLNSARAYITDNGNIRAEELREIRKRQEILAEQNKLAQKQLEQEAIDAPVKEKPAKKIKKPEPAIDETKETVTKKYNPKTMTSSSGKNKKK